MSPVPVELDIAVGIHGERASYHLETMGHVDPIALVNAIQEFVCQLLDAGEQGTPQASAPAEETGSVACEQGGSPVRSSADDPPEPRVKRPRPVGTIDERWTAAEARRHARIEANLKKRGVA